MSYGQMIDLIEQARQRGEDEEVTNSVLREQFDQWLYERQLDDLTDEEEEALWLAFQAGFGLS